MKNFVAFIVLSITMLFTGSPGEANTEDCNCNDTIPEGVDTGRIHRMIDSRVEAFASRKISEIDTMVRNAIVDSIQGLPIRHSRGKKLWIRWTDTDRRPNGHVYIWKWRYVIIRKDTLWDHVEVHRIK